MNRTIELTEDGSSTFFSELYGQHYHSIHGAIQESKHVFIDAGYNCMAHKSHITIFEMGFGTGLNALLTLLQAEQMAQNVDYYAVELYPIPAEEACKANFSEQLGVAVDRFRSLHSAEWDKAVAIDNRFTLTKIQGDLVNLELPLGIDLVYFDAFDPEAQPELWSETIFKKLYEAMSNEGVLVTYSSKGIVKQALRAAGFFVQRLSGPPGKRHMVRAIKREHE